MQVIKNNDHYLLKNDLGEYHLSIEDFEKLGELSAKELASSEIEKKVQNKAYTKVSINYEQARELGFCEYGIKDFANRLELNINESYTIKELYDKLDVHTFQEYPSECLKLFTNKVFDKFGGIVKFLDENRSRRSLNLVINHGNIEDNILHTLAYKSTLRVIDNFEKVYPNDDRPRKAIEAKKAFIEGKINDDELSAAWSAAESAAWSAAESAARSVARSAAWSAARSAAWSAARSAAWSAESVARSATRSAAWSAESAAWSAAWSAAESAARSAARSAELAELNFQIDTLIELLK